jgi:hypothetical protein
MLHRVVVLGSDGRKTFSGYAAAKGKTEAEIIQKYSAVGLFNCDGSWGSGQLTGSANTVTAAGHAFFAFESCRPFPRESCIFQPVASNEIFEVDLSSLQTK